MTIDYLKHTAIYLGLQSEQEDPDFNNFFVSLKSQFRIESNNLHAVSKTWNPLLPLLNITVL